MPATLFCNDCGKKFLYAAKQVTITNTDSIEKHVCPYCLNLNITEAPIVEAEKEQIEAVYVYDLKSGMQTELNELLAQGFEIVARYSKQYHLEKPKRKTADILAATNIDTISNEDGEATY